jgi:hypothetical protein
MIIREAETKDLDSLQELYLHLQVLYSHYNSIGLHKKE